MVSTELSEYSCFRFVQTETPHGSALTAIKSALSAEATAADSCLLPVLPAERFYRGVLVLRVRIIHTVYTNVIGQLLI